MKKRAFMIMIGLLLLRIPSFAQQQEITNFDFEKGISQNGYPQGWFPLGMKNFPYEIKLDTIEKNSGQYSIRIQSTEGATTQTFGSVATTIPAIYEGDSITVKAFIKTENVTEPIGLMLRIDNASYKILQFSNMMEQKIIGSPAWKEFSVSLPLPKEAKTIMIGAILAGDGKLWVDDFSLLIDGKDFKQAPIKQGAIIIYKADSDTLQFKYGSDIDISIFTKQQIENLTILGKVWGMMKYYHPAIAKGEYNWDYELFRIMPEILNAQSNNARNTILVQWVNKYGKLPAPNNEIVNKNKRIIKIEPDLAWISDKKLLGNDLVNYLAALKNTPKDTINYYINLSFGVGNPIFEHENSYSTMTYPDAGYRLLSLFKYWNIIQYYYPYKYLIGEDWNKVLPEFIPQFVNAKNELEYQTVLLKIITRVNDSHCALSPSDGNKLALYRERGKNHPLFSIRDIENKIVVSGILNDTISKELGIKEGDIITKINGISISQTIRNQYSTTPASNEAIKFRNILPMLLFSKDTVMHITFENKGEKDIPCVPLDSIKWGHKSNLPSYKMLPDSIGYIYIGTLVRDSIDFIMNKFKHTKGIVIDLRCYPKDFPLFDLGYCLMPNSIDFVKYTNGNISSPGQFYYVQTLSVGKENPEYYKGKIAILVNEITQSSAEYHAMAFRVAPTAKVLGSTTAGADGNVSRIILPGGVRTSITGVGVYYPDGGETQRIGIVPDIEIKPTIKGFIDGKDEVLEKAIEFISDKK